MLFNRGCCNRNNMFGMNMNQGMGCCGNQNFVEGEVIEPTTTKCIEKEIYHEVPHV